MIHYKLKLYKALKAKFGPVFGIFSALVYSVGISVAYIFMPGLGFNYMVSILGGEYSPGALYFNLGIIFSGILAIPLFFFIHIILKMDKTNKLLKNSALYLAITSCSSFCLVGIFPSLITNPLFNILHGIFFLISMMCAIIYLILYSIIFLKSNQFSKTLSYICYINIATIIVFLITWNPLIEWIMTFAIIAWFVSISIFLLIKVP